VHAVQNPTFPWAGAIRFVAKSSRFDAHPKFLP
jgi:hypothetical protein